MEKTHRKMCLFLLGQILSSTVKIDSFLFFHKEEMGEIL